MHRKVLTLALALSLLGLASEFLALATFPEDYRQTVSQFQGFISFVNLTFFRFQLVEVFYPDSGLTMNFLNVTFYTLLLLGATLFAWSNEKETRLVRFVLSIMLITAILWMVTGIISPMLYWSAMPNKGTTLILLTVGLIKNAGIGYLIFRALSYLNENKRLQLASEALPHNPEETTPPTGLASTNILTRGIHFVVDTIVCLLIFTGFAHFLPFLQTLENTFGEQFALIVFFLLARVCYYPFFEILFSATPAKLLAESRVVTDDEKTPDRNTIIVRTLCRFIPFEPFSFLGKRGWHDSLSKTKVVDEVKTGKDGAMYLLIFPAIALIGVAGLVIETTYSSYQFKVDIKAENEWRMASGQKTLSNLSTSDVIQIVDEPPRSHESQKYLKVEAIDGDKIEASLIENPVYNDDLISLVDFERLYERSKRDREDTLVTISRSDMEKAYMSGYDERLGTDNFSFTGGALKFRILRIDRAFGPSLRDENNYGPSGTNLNIQLSNYGWPCSILSLETLEGTIKWKNELPIALPTYDYSHYRTVTISGTNYKPSDRYKLKMVVADTLRRNHTFIIEGVDGNKTIERVN